MTHLAVADTTALADVLPVLEVMASGSIHITLRIPKLSSIMPDHLVSLFSSHYVATQCLLLQPNTPLHQATQAGHTHVAELLIIAGADVTAKDNAVSELCLSPSACTA